jgi:hypothetical protein
VVLLQDGKLVASGPRDGVLEALKKQKEAAALAASAASADESA